MRWIKTHKFITVFLVLLLILVILFALTMGGVGSNRLSDGVNKGMSYILAPLTAVTQTVRDAVGGLFSYRQLQKQVETLTAENDELRRELAQAELKQSELKELESLSALLQYDYTETTFDVVTASVISFDGSNWTNIFTIDKGTESGVEVGATVISGEGLIGRVSEAGSGWAQVVSIIDDGSKVSFMLARDHSLLGVVEGDQQGEIAGYMLESDAVISEGDVIITSGMGLYPAGLEIGRIKSVTYNSDTILREVTVEAAVNFRSLRKVAVIL